MSFQPLNISFFQFQTTVMDLTKATKTLVYYPRSSTFHNIKRKLDDIQNEIHVHMVQLERPNTDFLKRMNEKNPRNSLVSPTSKVKASDFELFLILTQTLASKFHYHQVLLTVMYHFSPIITAI